MRTRTRTISLVVEERREAGLGKDKEVSPPLWTADRHIAEGSRGSSVDGGEGSEHCV